MKKSILLATLLLTFILTTFNSAQAEQNTPKDIIFLKNALGDTVTATMSDLGNYVFSNIQTWPVYYNENETKSYLAYEDIKAKNLSKDYKLTERGEAYISLDTPLVLKVGELTYKSREDEMALVHFNGVSPNVKITNIEVNMVEEDFGRVIKLKIDVDTVTITDHFMFNDNSGDIIFRGKVTSRH